MCSACVPDLTRKSAIGDSCAKTDDCVPEAICRDLVCLDVASLCPEAPLFEIEGVDYSVSCPPDRATCFTYESVHNPIERPCICRDAEECGGGSVCMRGPGCYCSCNAPTEQPNPVCDDPMCEAVTVRGDE